MPAMDVSAKPRDRISAAQLSYPKVGFEPRLRINAQGRQVDCMM